TPARPVLFDVAPLLKPLRPLFPIPMLEPRLLMLPAPPVPAGDGLPVLAPPPPVPPPPPPATGAAPPPPVAPGSDPGVVAVFETGTVRRVSEPVNEPSTLTLIKRKSSPVMGSLYCVRRKR